MLGARYRSLKRAKRVCKHYYFGSCLLREAGHGFKLLNPDWCNRIGIDMIDCPSYECEIEEEEVGEIEDE